MSSLFASLIAQGIFCTLAIIFNILLAYVVIRARRQDVGFYKWLLVAYASFEIIYAATVLQGMPIHVVADRTWIFFSFRGPLMGTPVAFLSSAMYCFFYEVWMGLVVMNFIYRYVVVCRADWVDIVKRNSFLKALLVFSFFSFIALCSICTIYLCAINKISPKMEDKLVHDFYLEDVKRIGYTMLRLVDLNGDVSVSGILATLIHIFVVAASASIVAFCSLRIWIRIKTLQKMQDKTNLSLEKQLFRTLLIQTIIPVFLCHLPSAAHLTFAFWDEFPLDVLTPYFSVFTTIPKAIDPLIAFICIAEYRSSLRRLLGCRRENRISGYTNSENQNHAVSTIQKQSRPS